MSSDPFEEFEFRPLTEGLGFHRQADKKPAPSSSSSFELKNSLPEIEMPLSPRAALEKPVEPRTSLRRSPLPEESKTTDSSGSVDEILKTLHNKRKAEFIEQRNAAENQGPAYRTSAPDISSFILDGMLVTAASLACLIILLMVTKIDLFGVITQTDDTTVYLTLFGLFAAVSWIYLVMNRVFLGFTPGEWVFDQRVGLPQKHGSAEYCLRVTARSTLVVLTGLIVFPIVSMVMGRDFAGQLTGAALLKKV